MARKTRSTNPLRCDLRTLVERQYGQAASRQMFTLSILLQTSSRQEFRLTNRQKASIQRLLEVRRWKGDRFLNRTVAVLSLDLTNHSKPLIVRVLC